jgi:isopenicillin N synthase-like dioxygenase
VPTNREDPLDNRGYIKTSREKLSLSSDVIEIDALRVTAPDYKETMEIGRDWNSVWKNRWPEETDVPGFKQAMLAFYQVSSLLVNDTIRAQIACCA